MVVLLHCFLELCDLEDMFAIVISADGLGHLRTKRLRYKDRELRDALPELTAK